MGVYGGVVNPLPMLQLFDKGIQIRMGQAHVKRWVDDVMPLVADPSDPLGLESFASHRLPLEEAPRAYEVFQKKQDGALENRAQALMLLLKEPWASRKGAPSSGLGSG